MTRVSLSSVSPEGLCGALSVSRSVSREGASSACPDRWAGTWRVGSASGSPGGSRWVSSDPASPPRGPVLRRSSGRSSGLSLISPPFSAIFGPCDTPGFYPVSVRKAHLRPFGPERTLFVHSAQNRTRWLRPACTVGHIQPARAFISWPMCRQDTPYRGYTQSRGGKLGHGEQAERSAAGPGAEREVHPVVVHRHPGDAQELRHHSR